MHQPEIRVLSVGPLSVWFHADGDIRARYVPKWQWLDPRRYSLYCRTRSGRWQFTVNATRGGSSW